MASQICLALCNFPGVRHTALLHMKERGDLQLVAQEAQPPRPGRLLQRRDRLLQSPLRDVFPPLMAVARGELVLLMRRKSRAIRNWRCAARPQCAHGAGAAAARRTGRP
jgi:hypothetical protein